MSKMAGLVSVTDLQGNGVAPRLEGKDHGATVSFFLSHPSDRMIQEWVEG